MTSTVKVTSHNYPVLVETWDKLYNHHTNKVSDEWTKTDYKVLEPSHGETVMHVTTTRKLVIYDLEKVPETKPVIEQAPPEAQSAA